MAMNLAPQSLYCQGQDGRHAEHAPLMAGRREQNDSPLALKATQAHVALLQLHLCMLTFGT